MIEWSINFALARARSKIKNLGFGVIPVYGLGQAEKARVLTVPGLLPS